MKDSKICKHCEKEYSGRGKMYCSRLCADQSKIGKEKHGKLEKPECVYCGGRCKRPKLKFCSPKCYAESRRGKPNGTVGRVQSKETIRKRVENTDQAKKEEKRIKTMLDRYGVENASQLPEFAETVSKALTGKPRPRKEGQQEAIIESKRRNGTLKHSEETKKEFSEVVKNRLADLDFDRSVFVSNGSNGKNSKTGYCHGLYFRSSYEEMFIKFCEHYNIKLESAANNQHCVKYLASDNQVRSYYPDFYLPESNTTVEIKPISMYEVGENQNKFTAALDSVENYVVLSELDGFICENEWEDFYNNEVKYWVAELNQLR